MFSAYDRRKDLRTISWIIAMGRFITFAAVNTVLVLMFYADDGSCAKYAAEAACTENRYAVNALFASCEWHPENFSCVFSRPPVDFVTIMVFITVVYLVSVPINKLIEACARALQELATKHSKSRHK